MGALIERGGAVPSIKTCVRAGADAKDATGGNMRARPVEAFVVAVGLCVASPTLGQTAAPQPTMSAEQAVQLFEEAGFRVENGRPVNRCGGASEPRVSFIDLNGDGRAEAHIADVDLRCYGKPGAYFAILAREADGSWKRLIAEDGIVGFERARTSGWNELSLEARDSACPGTRRFNGADYGTTDCGAAVAAALASSSDLGVDAPAAAVSALQGTRTERLAQLFRNLVAATGSRSYETAMAAFPDATWRNRTSFAPRWGGITTSQGGSIGLGGAVYDIAIEGTADSVASIGFTGPGNDNLPWEPIEVAIRAIGMESRNIGCHSPTGFGYVRLTDGDRSAILHKFLNFGTLVPSTDVYIFNLDDPLDGRTEAEVAADRSLC
jgi:hypothetical protein